jgi:hypothetical protein
MAQLIRYSLENLKFKIIFKNIKKINSLFALRIAQFIKILYHGRWYSN